MLGDELSYSMIKEVKYERTHLQPREKKRKSTAAQIGASFNYYWMQMVLCSHSDNFF